MLNADKREFQVFLESLEKISYSKEVGGSITNSHLLAVNFDRYTKSAYKHQNTPASNDALFFTATNNFFIEFKGGKGKNIETEELHKKNYDSINTLVVKAQEDVENIRQFYRYVLVYHPDAEPKPQIGSELAKLADEEYIPFNLDSFIGTHFADVYTLSPYDFNNSFIAQHLAPCTKKQKKTPHSRFSSIRVLKIQ